MTIQRHPNPAREIERIFGLIAAVCVTGAIGLAAVDAGRDAPTARTLPRDANEQSTHRAPVRFEPAAAIPLNANQLDPSLRRIDHAGAHHG